MNKILYVCFLLLLTGITFAQPKDIVSELGMQYGD